MIRYALACEQAHEFDSWFASSASFDAQQAQGLITCPYCNSARVEKQLMLPQLARKDRPVAEAAPTAVLAPEVHALRQKLRELHEHVTKTAENVGEKFADEARKIHYGETEERAIYGQANREQAESLIDEGISFHLLPSLPDDRH